MTDGAKSRGWVQTEAAPDKGWSWVVAFASFSSCLILSGTVRTFSVFLVGFMDTFGTTRENASWPLVVHIAALDLTGILSGILGQKFGIRPVSILGSLIATVGVSACFFFTSLTSITVFFGIIFGIGSGLAFTLLSAIINQYFVKYRTTANGIMLSGSSIGAAIFPPIYMYLITKYGLSGSFLLIGGIILQTVVCGVVMRPPPWYQTPRKTNLGGNSNYAITNMSDMKKNKRIKCVSNKGEVDCVNDCCLKPVNPKPAIKTIFKETNELNEIEKVTLTSFKRSSQIVDTYTKTRRNVSSNATYSSTDIANFNNLNINEIPIPQFDKVQNIEKLQPNDLEAVNMPLSIIKSFKHIFMFPMYHVIAIAFASFIFSFYLYNVIIIDFMLDSGVSEENIKYVLISFAVTDCLSRLCFGWVTDRKYLKKSYFAMICMMGQSVIFFIYPAVHGVILHTIFSIMFGLLTGCTMPLFPVLIVDCVGMETQTIAFGYIDTVVGVAMLMWPSLIGYFRDTLGSYSNMFYLLAALQLGASLLWPLEKCFI